MGTIDPVDKTSMKRYYYDNTIHPDSSHPGVAQFQRELDARAAANKKPKRDISLEDEMQELELHFADEIARRREKLAAEQLSAEQYVAARLVAEQPTAKKRSLENCFSLLDGAGKRRSLQEDRFERDAKGIRRDYYASEHPCCSEYYAARRHGVANEHRPESPACERNAKFMRLK